MQNINLGLHCTVRIQNQTQNILILLKIYARVFKSLERYITKSIMQSSEWVLQVFFFFLLYLSKFCSTNVIFRKYFQENTGNKKEIKS